MGFGPAGEAPKNPAPRGPETPETERRGPVIIKTYNAKVGKEPPCRPMCIRERWYLDLFKALN